MLKYWELWKGRELVQLYQDQAHFQVQYGAPFEQKVWQATSRADQGLMMLIDRNMDRLAKRYHCKKISTKLQGQRRVSVFYGCQLSASSGTNRRVSNPTGTDDISHLIARNFMIRSNLQPRAVIETTLMSFLICRDDEKNFIHFRLQKNQINNAYLHTYTESIFFQLIPSLKPRQGTSPSPLEKSTA